MKIIELQNESKFNGFLVDLRVGLVKVLNKVMFGGKSVFTYMGGAFGRRFFILFVRG